MAAHPSVVCPEGRTLSRSEHTTYRVRPHDKTSFAMAESAVDAHAASNLRIERTRFIRSSG